MQMKIIIRPIVLLMIFSFVSFPSYAIEIDQAIKAANQHLATIDIDVQKYKLISAQNMSIYDKKYIGPKSWFLTYKLRSLIPESERLPSGTGGEIFVLFNGSISSFKVTYGK